MVRSRIHKQRRRLVGGLKAVLVVAGVVGASSPAIGTAKGETSQQAGQQSLGVHGGESSEVIMGGPELIVGTIDQIRGDEFAIRGDRGQYVRLQVTKDTNKVCSDGASMPTGQEQIRERSEIPPKSARAEDAASGRAIQKQPSHSPARETKEASTPQHDPSQLQSTVGTTDPEAKKDVAQGSGFVVGLCNFSVGDQVRVEGSDMGTITTIKQLSRRTNSKNNDH
ncbi:MAG: hypothetical protein ACXW4A_05935 [Nitrospira sp.]